MITEELVTEVKLAIYRVLADTALAPTAGDLAASLRLPEQDVLEAFSRLHAKRLLVPEPGDPTRIRMAPPFSGIPTAFPVDSRGKRYYANCVWDAYGISAALHSDAVIPASDGLTRELLTLEVRGGEPLARPWVCHFAVPAARWWEDIIFT